MQLVNIHKVSPVRAGVKLLLSRITDSTMAAAAAPVPPKKRVSLRHNRKANSSDQVLTQMGFPKHRADKALAATGHRGAQLAADWLLSHVNDPSIDEETPREYVLYACPTGPFLDLIQNFWSQSLFECGWNSAHNYIPHITLSSVFKAPDTSVSQLVSCLKETCQKFRLQICDKLKLEYHSSKSFIGFFVAEEHAPILKNLAYQYITDVSQYMINDYDMVDVIATCFPWCSSPNMSYFSPSRGSIFRARSFATEPFLKDLRLTLAYNFDVKDYCRLDRLCRTIDASTPAGWEVRLYSRESRVSGNDVFKVIYSHVPRDTDELELLIGDFVYVSPDQMKQGSEGWVEATSWLTGCSGNVPTNYIQRTAESDSWTLHEKQLLIPSTDENESLDASDKACSSPWEDYKNITENERDDGKIGLIDFGMNSNKLDDGSTRQVYIVRHGERVDFTFRDWISECFDASGNYTPNDLNQPNSVPPRRPDEFFLDCPLTKVGLLQAHSVGEAVKESNVKFSHAFCSPSLRCVQTCHNILQGSGLEELSINVEPGLFEWLQWLPQGLPDWVSLKELSNLGYNVNQSYKPFVSRESMIACQESCAEYYDRNFSSLQNALRTTENSGGNILVVAHASSLDTCTRQLIGKSPRQPEVMAKMLRSIPYCSVVRCVQSAKAKEWSLKAAPFSSFSSTNNSSFNYQCLL